MNAEAVIKRYCPAKNYSFLELTLDETEKNFKVNFSEKGRGVVALTPIPKGHAVLRYMGNLMTASEGRALEKEYGDTTGSYMFFVNEAGQNFW